MEIINSTNNPMIKYWNQLKSKKWRDKEKLFLIEGIKLIGEALQANYYMENIIVLDSSKHLGDIQKLLQDNGRNIPITIVSEAIILKLTDTETPQGFFAVLRKKELELDNLLTKEFLLLLDEIQDPGNLGTIIRSADASGVDVIILGKGTVELYNPKVIRSAMGSIFHLSIVEADLDTIIPKLKENSFNIIGSSPYAEESYYEVDLKSKTAILIGNEAKGLSKERIESVNQMVKIPIKGKAESLNVAIATALLLYERVRQIETSS